MFNPPNGENKFESNLGAFKSSAVYYGLFNFLLACNRVLYDIRCELKREKAPSLNYQAIKYMLLEYCYRKFV